ncbi:Acetyl-CoA:oxalate CoA-transferase [compost metagenome]
MTGPLAGMRVIDASNFVFGPMATQMLADMGAEVIKVEPPQGDPMRMVGTSRNPKMGSFFLNLNRGKRSVVLDLKDAGDVARLDALLATADVFVHNMRPAAARRLGIAYENLAPRHPRLVYAVALGFHQDGRYAERPAYDDVIQGMSGVSGLHARMYGEPGFVPMLFTDKLCGVYLAGAIASALVARAASGQGQQVEVPMFETMASFNLVEHLADGIFSGARAEAPARGYERVFSRYHRPLKTREGHVCLVANTDAQWQRLFSLLGRPELTADPRFATMGDRIRHAEPLYEEISESLLARGAAEWLALFLEHDIPAGPANGLDELLNDPHLADVGFFQTVEHPTEGALRCAPTPFRFSASPRAAAGGAPGLGEHNGEILG